VSGGADFQPVTTVHIALYGIDADHGRLSDLVDVINHWANDNLGIDRPPLSWDTYHVPDRREPKDRRGE
jgi:hypothetical protein